MDTIKEKQLPLSNTGVPEESPLHILVEELLDKRKTLLGFEERTKILNKEINMLNQQVFQTMLIQNVKSFKRPDGITVSSYSEEVYYIDKDKKQEFLEDARCIGWDCFIKEDFNWRTLQTLIKDLKEAIQDETGTSRTKTDNIVKLENIQRYLQTTTKNNIRILGLKTWAEGNTKEG